jgi:hypothetical protein
MSDERASFAPDPNVWTNVPPPLRHSYGLSVRNHGLGTATGLLFKSLPYAFARFGILLAYAVACIIWIVVAFGGAAWLGAHVAKAFGLMWFVLCVVGVGWFWGTVLRYALHLVACGPVAVLTELIIRGEVGNGSESMLSYGKRIVIQRFGEVTILFGMNMLVRGILNAFHRTLDWIDQMIPIPGLESLSSLAIIILRAATCYLDKVILSYNLARARRRSLGRRSGGSGLLRAERETDPDDISLDRHPGASSELRPLASVAGPGRRHHHDAAHRRARKRWSGHRADRDPAGRYVTVSVHQAAVSHHDDGALPHPDRKPADPSGMGCSAGSRVGEIQDAGRRVFDAGITWYLAGRQPVEQGRKRLHAG